MRTLISLAALAVILFGVRFAYGRERLRKADLHQWYQEDNAKLFAGELPDAYIRWEGLQKEEWLGVTEVSELGYLEIVLDPYELTTEAEVRSVLHHEECHAATWGEEPAHGPQFQACKARLQKFVEVK